MTGLWRMQAGDKAGHDSDRTAGSEDQVGPATRGLDHATGVRRSLQSPHDGGTNRNDAVPRFACTLDQPRCGFGYLEALWSWWFVHLRAGNPGVQDDRSEGDAH